MIDRLNIWVRSKFWFWKFRTWLVKLAFFFERSAYKGNSSVSKAKTNAQILGSFAWIGVKSLCWVVLVLAALFLVEGYVGNDLDWLPALSTDDRKFIIDQLRLYAQLLAAIFSIYFATIGIILSAGYTRLRRDIIQMLTNEQVGSVYSRVLVLTAMFSLAATALPIFEFKPGLLIYAFGTILTLLSVLALFPLGQRLFNFFDLNLLVRSEILPSIARHIEGASNPKNSISLGNHHSKAAQQALEQLYYIDDQIKSDKRSFEYNLLALSDDYTILLLHYIQQKHRINKDCYWFPRRRTHKQWFFAGDAVTSMALRMSSQQLLIDEKTDHQWLENEIIDKLADHVELAFKVGDFDLALKLIGRFSVRSSAYAVRFQFDVGMQELKRLKKIIENGFASSDTVEDAKISKLKIGIADTWAALGSNLCFETLRRMITFEVELKKFFEMDQWSEKSMHRLPAFLQVELAFIVEYIEFEQNIEGKRLSRSKYVQQLAVQKLLQNYAKLLPTICELYQNLIPDFVDYLVKLNMSVAATQVVLASLHSHWKIQGWFDEIAQLVDRYYEYEHYTAEHYKLPEINTLEMSKQLVSARDDAITRLSSGAMVSHIFASKHDDELPDHFGQIYFELSETCINALEQNDESKLLKVFPMFMSLAFLADSKFADPFLDVSDESRMHLVSTVINDLASVLGFSILYGAYFNNENLTSGALEKFDALIELVPDKQQYFKRMVLLSNPNKFSFRASPRGLIRTEWKMLFQRRARHDGFEDQMGMTRGKPHPNKIVREFLWSMSDVSHLFFAVHIMPQIGPVDFNIDYHITDLVRRLREECEEVQYEDI